MVFKFDYKAWGIVGLTTGIIYTILAFIYASVLVWVMPGTLRAIMPAGLVGLAIAGISIALIVLEIVYFVFGRAVLEFFGADATAFWRTDYQRLWASAFTGRLVLSIILLVIAKANWAVLKELIVPLLVGSILTTIVAWAAYRVMNKPIPV